MGRGPNDQLCEFHILDFSNLREEVATLRIEVRALVSIKNLDLPSIPYLIPTSPTLVFNYFKDDKAATNMGKRIPSPEGHSVSYDEFEKDLRMVT